MSAALVPIKWRRAWAAAWLLAPLAGVVVLLVVLAWLFPVGTSPLMLPFASVVTVAAMAFVGAGVYGYRDGIPPWHVPPLPRRVDACDWRPEPGSVLVGVTDAGPRTEIHGGYAFAAWRKDPHLLLAGSTGAGKSATVLWAARSLLASGYRIAGFDGKGSGLLRPLEGRERIIGVADDPGEWVELVGAIKAEMDYYYDQLRRWRSGHGARPEPVRVALVVDELVDLLDSPPVKKSFLPAFSAVVRMGRQADIRVVASVLRPDVAEAIPGLIKAQMRARVALGAPTPQTGQMLFEDRWADVRKVMDRADVPGRGVALLDGRAYRVQLPLVTDPAEGDGSWLPPYKAAAA